MVQSLKAHPHIQVQRVYLTEPAEAYELHDLIRQLPAPMPEGMRQMYEELGDFELSWKHPDLTVTIEGQQSKEPVEGSIRILPLSKLAQDWEDIIWFDFMEPDNPARSLIPFDLYMPEACAVMRPVDDHMAIDYHYCTEDLWPTGMNFDQWFDALIMSRGLMHWLEACTVPGQSSFQTHFLFEVGPRLFDDFDPKYFAPQTKQGAIEF